MLKYCNKLIKFRFGFQPQRSSRYFSLRVQLKEDLPLSQTILEQHNKHLSRGEQSGEILFAGKEKNRKVYEYLFQSPNQLQPYYFVKKSPFHLHNMIAKYDITEIELQLKVRDKQLAPAYLRE